MIMDTPITQGQDQTRTIEHEPKGRAYGTQRISNVNQTRIDTIPSPVPLLPTQIDPHKSHQEQSTNHMARSNGRSGREVPPNIMSSNRQRSLKETPLVSVRVSLCASVEEWWTLNE